MPDLASRTPRPFRKVVCVGLDGATFDVIDPMIRSGRLPNLARLLATGARSSLTSTIPPLSAPAWVSFMTGMNPGRHGVFHFRAMERGALGAGLVGSWAIRGKTIFDHACRAGLNIVAFRVPMTYPPWPLNGVVVSGFPTPDPRATYSEPPEIAQQMGPVLKLGAGAKLVAGVEAQVDNFDFYQSRCTEAAVRLLRDQHPDLFCYVNSVTDWMAHKFWGYSESTGPDANQFGVPGGALVEHFYERADASLGDVLSVAQKDALVVVLSDHGMGPRSHCRFSTNAWLAEQGLLARPARAGVRAVVPALLEAVRDGIPNKTALKQWLWKNAPPLRDFMRKSAGALPGYGGPIDWRRSKAYRVAMHDLVEGVNVNLAGRESQGCVPAADFEEVRDSVVAAARGLVDPATGARVFDAVYRREELYRGDHAHVAPDVVLVLDPAYEFGRGTARRSFGRISQTSLKRSSATHRPDGILVLAGPGVRRGSALDGASLVDVPATILWALGVELPEEMDGRVLTEAFEGEAVRPHPIRWSAGSPQQTPEGVYTPEEQRRMEEHLEDLGYL
jgi:predicted AlkP superfamily phosphohydrolase/phosphomutase